MLPSFLLTLREGLEAALIVGLALGVLAKMKRSQYAPAVWGGVGLAGLLSLGVALGLNALGAELTGAAEEIFEGVTMFLAAGVLTWMIFWMQRQGRQVQQGLEAEIRAAAGGPAGRGPGWGLFAIAFFAVLREGIETALFLTAAVFTSSASETLWGAVLGLAAAGLLGWWLFAAALRLNLRRFFQVTGGLLILFAAGLVAHGVHEFNEAGLIPAVVEHVWNFNPLLDEKSPAGGLLTALFGYNGNPSLTEVLAYAAYFLALFTSLWAAGQRRPLPAPVSD